MKNSGFLSKTAKRAVAARENGSCGGKERAARHSQEKLSQWASRGGAAVLAKYGVDYFVELRKRRQNYPKYREPVVVLQASPRVLAAKCNGQRGGQARAESYGPETLKEWARQGGVSTRQRCGKDFYRRIRKLRTHYRKGYLTRKTKERLTAGADHIIDRIAARLHSL